MFNIFSYNVNMIKMLHSKNERDNNYKANGQSMVELTKCSLRRTFCSQEHSNFKRFLQVSRKDHSRFISNSCVKHSLQKSPSSKDQESENLSVGISSNMVDFP